MPGITAPSDDRFASGKLLAAVIMLAAIARFGIMLALPAGLNVDTDGYRRIAIAFRATGTLGVMKEVPQPGETVSSFSARLTAYRPPLYPLLLSVFVSEGELSPRAVASLNLVFGAATAGLVAWLASRWGLGRWSLLAGFITACDPILLHQSTQIMTETLAAFLSAGSLACLTWLINGNVSSRPPPDQGWRGTLAFGFLAGMALGLASLCRPTFLPWSILVALSFFTSRNKAAKLANSSRMSNRDGVDGAVRARQRKPFKLDQWAAVVSLSAGILLVVLPWGLRNYWQFGHFKLTTTHGGYTLMLGNNPSFYRYLREGAWGEVWHGDDLDRAWAARGTKADDEFADDRLAYQWAHGFIRAEPRMFAQACLVRAARLWNVLPHRLSDRESVGRWVLRIATACWYVAVYGLVAVAVVRQPKRLLQAPWLWGVLLCGTFTAVHTFYWSDMRMRAPLMPFVAILAAAGACEWKLRHHSAT